MGWDGVVGRNKSVMYYLSNRIIHTRSRNYVTEEKRYAAV
jgi:hypothetical protein